MNGAIKRPFPLSLCKQAQKCIKLFSRRRSVSNNARNVYSTNKLLPRMCTFWQRNNNSALSTLSLVLVASLTPQMLGQFFLVPSWSGDHCSDSREIKANEQLCRQQVKSDSERSHGRCSDFRLFSQANFSWNDWFIVCPRAGCFTCVARFWRVSLQSNKLANHCVLG